MTAAPDAPPPAAETIRVLMIEDDEKLARLTAKYLEKHGLEVVWAGDGEAGLRAATRTAFDAILLDLMLPGLGGLEICREIRRRSDVPVLMLTARGEEADRVLGLEIGADDYIGKPFSSRELLARIHAHVRRARGRLGPRHRPLTVGPLRIDLAGMSVTVRGALVDLTSYEFSLLRALAERQGHVLSREQLLDLARGSAEEAFDRSVDVHIFRLRQKIEADPRHPRLLKTVRGAGYLLADGGESE